ncbi:hypothetical protein E5288_WYG012985 [Bos mutus]|uniref:Uncharacterized protein n=1 Tax=Bos mutus TaxID=72004 RepID=A0A6B0R9Y8_9CETA|nr:hypothetical protein [Bos mutus]
MKMSRVCLSAALLFLLVILVDSTPVYEQNTQDQGLVMVSGKQLEKRSVLSVVDLVDQAVMTILITDSLPLPFQQLLGLLSAWSINSQVPALLRRSDTFTMPRLGTVSTLYTVAVMERRTTSSLKGIALRPAVKGQGPRGKTGARAQEEGKGWGKRWSSGGHTPFTLHSVFLLAGDRRGCSVL